MQGIKLAKEKEEKEEKAWTRRQRRFGKWLVGFIDYCHAYLVCVGQLVRASGFEPSLLDRFVCVRTKGPTHIHGRR